jgi:methyl-accepting chemotaxis protein
VLAIEIEEDFRIRGQAERELAAQLAGADRLMAVTDAIMSDRVKNALAPLQERGSALGEAPIDDVALLGDQQVPNLRFGGQSQVGSFELVDSVTAVAGGTATLFVRRGDDFVRVSTNVRRYDKPAVGTRLDAAASPWSPTG